MPSGEEISEAFENYLSAIEDRDRNRADQRGLPHSEETARRLRDHFVVDSEEPEQQLDDDQRDTPHGESPDGQGDDPR